MPGTEWMHLDMAFQIPCRSVTCNASGFQHSWRLALAGCEAYASCCAGPGRSISGFRVLQGSGLGASPRFCRQGVGLRGPDPAEHSAFIFSLDPLDHERTKGPAGSGPRTIRNPSRGREGIAYFTSAASSQSVSAFTRPKKGRWGRGSRSQGVEGYC